MEEEVRRALAANAEAWNNRDIDALMDGGWTRGFGFRSYTPRTEQNLPPEMVRDALIRFLDSVDHYKVIPGEVTVAIDRDIALIWGFHTEEVRHKGQPMEIIKVRSSATMRRTADGRWRTLLGHRDIQQFDEDGRYIPVFGEKV